MDTGKIDENTGKMKKIYEPVKGRHTTIDTNLDPEKNAKLAAQKLSN
jgi:hypothetical protein